VWTAVASSAIVNRESAASPELRTPAGRGGVLGAERRSVDPSEWTSWLARRDEGARRP